MNVSLAEIAAAVGCPKVEHSPMVTSVVSDTRQVSAGALFVCIQGEHVDGHSFAAQAVAAGAVAVLAEKPVADVNAPVLLVPNSVAALGRIAAFWRKASKAQVVGITGTAGKTTVKEVLSQIVSACGATAKNELNLNNQIGMPTCMLRTTGQEAFWIFEAGISHEKDMDELGSVLRPDLALILNAGTGHIEGLGKMGVAWHKARLLCHLAPQGQALVCADYPDLAREAQKNFPAVRFFSARDAQAEFYAQPLGMNAAGQGEYSVRLGQQTFVVQTPFCGSYGAENVAAIAAAAYLLGIDVPHIQQGFARAHLPQQRFACHCIKGLTLIDDSYNANPLSMNRMLDAAKEKAGQQPLCLVLGEMRELGACAEQEHEALGRHVAALTPKAFFWKGGQVEAVQRGLTAGGYSGAVHRVHTAQEFLPLFVDTFLSKGVEGTVLFKGSHSNHLEEMVQVCMSWLEK